MSPGTAPNKTRGADILKILSHSAVARAYAQSSGSSSSGGSYVSNVRIDPNLTPGKNFTIQADVKILQSSTAGSNEIQVAISVPAELSISPSVIYDLGGSSGGSTRTVQWIATASKSGSFPVMLTVYSTDTSTGVQTSNSLNITISVGSLKSVSITELNIPGNLVPNSDFIVSAKIRNSGLVAADNIIAQINVPVGMQVIGNVTQNLGAVQPGGDVFAQWELTALAAGSNSITIQFSSTNGGSDSISGTVVVGSRLVPDLSSSAAYLGSNKSSSIQIRPGDVDIPIHIELANTGNLPIYDIVATLNPSEPFYFKTGNSSTSSPSQSVRIAQLNVGAVSDSQFFISVRPSAAVGPYDLTLKANFTDNISHYEKDILVPVVLSANSLISVSQVTHIVKPGYLSTVKISVANTGDLTIHDLSISTQTNSQFTAVYSPVYVGNLAVSETKTVDLQLYTSPQTNDVSPLGISLDYQAGGQTFHQTQQIGLSFAGTPTFALRSVTLTPSISYPGDKSIKMDANVANTGYVIAHNVTVSLSLPPGISPSWGNSTTMYVGDILPSATAMGSFVFDLSSNLSSQTYPMKAVLSYSKGSAQLPINFVASPKANFQITNVDDSSLFPGAAGVPLKVAVKNVGGATAKSVTGNFLGGNTVAGVKSSTVTSLGNIASIGDVATGQQVTTVFLVNVDQYVTKGSQISTLELSWTQDNKTFVQDVPLPYNIAPGPNYLLYYGGVPLTYVIVGIGIAALIVAFFIVRSRRNRAISATIEVTEPAMLRQEKELTHKKDIANKEEEEEET